MNPTSLLRAYVLGYPVVLPAAFYLTWVMGRWSLGRWPRPSLDDPKSIGVWVDVAHGVTGVLASVGLAVFVMALAALGWRVLRARSGPDRSGMLRMVVLATAAMVGSVLLLRWDPLGVVSWFMD